MLQFTAEINHFTKCMLIHSHHLKGFSRGPIPPSIDRPVTIDCLSDLVTLLLFSCVLQDRPYPMDQPRLGHAVIVNNVATEQPGSNVDVTALKAAYEKVGLDVHVHDNCDVQVNVNNSLAPLLIVHNYILY